MIMTEKDYNYEYPIRAMRWGDTEINVRKMRVDEMPEIGKTYYCELNGSIYEEGEKDFEIIKSEKELYATAIIKEEIESLKEISQYPSSAIGTLEKVLAKIEGRYHSTEPVKFTNKQDNIINL